MAADSFETLAERTLAAILARVEERLDDVEADLQGGILTLELDDGRRYLLNKHAPNRQIWLSSPVSGATHFDWHGESGSWRSTRGGEALLPLLARELSEATGREIAFG